jgi:DNA-binding GntR family transcriptional regulator
MQGKLQVVKKSTRLSDQAYKIIKESIIKNQLKPGEALKEEYLARQLEISRTPVKTALNRLVYEGIATLNENGQVVVSNITADDVRSVTLVRRLLEGLAISLLKDVFQLAQLNELRGFQRRELSALENDDMDEYGEMDYQFHIHLARYTGNRFLYETVTNIELVIKRYLILSGTLPKYSPVACEEHEKVLDALAKKDFEAARQAMEDHLVNVDRRMLIH